jgi:hypothetical protein
MPTHDTYREQLLDLAYGELGRREARALRAHLETCPACRGELERIGATRGTMAELRDEPAPDRGLPTLLAAAREAARGRAQKPLFPPWLWGASVAAVGLAAVAVVSFKLSGTGSIPAGRTGEVDLVAHAPAPEAPAGFPAAEPPAKLEESAPTTADLEAPAAKLAAPPPPARPDRPAPARILKPSKPLAAALASREAAKEAKAAPAPQAEAERAAGGARDEAAEAAGNAAVAAPAPSGAGPEPGAPSAAEAQQPHLLAVAPGSSSARGAVASEVASSSLRRAKSASTGRLRTSAASFTGCPGESSREVDRDEQGRVVRYLRRGVFRGTAFEAELLYGDDGALSEVRYRAAGQVRTFRPGAVGEAGDADAGGVPAALLEPRRAEDAGPDAPPRCGG